MNLIRLVAILAAASVGISENAVRAAEEAVDFQKARQIHERAQRGEPVTAEERAYVARAMKLYQERNSPPPPAKWTQHLTPLTELVTGDYKGQDGGLYGGGRNEPPKPHLDAALREAAMVRPLDARGKFSEEGRIGLLSVGMSNTTQEFSTFLPLANRDSRKSPRVTLVDGAQGGQTGMRWADAATPLWQELDRRLEAAGITASQVQVVWMKQAEAGPARLGEFPKHAEILRDNLVKSLGNLKAKFPNLRIAYLSSRIYGGYATTPLNPEPYAFETAFAMRWLIQDQIAGKPELNFDAKHGEVKAPILLWGPYLWADGETPRKADGLAYQATDFGQDGTHPSPTGRQKVADQLLRFFTTDPTATVWFLKR
jgi:hypothetical protein